MKIPQIKAQRAVAESKKKAQRLVSKIQYEINLIRKADNPESAMEKAMRECQEKFINGKMEVTLEEQTLIDNDMAREMAIYPVMRNISNIMKIEERFKKSHPRGEGWQDFFTALIAEASKSKSFNSG